MNDWELDIPGGEPGQESRPSRMSRQRVGALIALAVLVPLSGFYLASAASGRNSTRTSLHDRVASSTPSQTSNSSEGILDGKVRLGPAARLKIRAHDFEEARENRRLSEFAGSVYVVKDEGGEILEVGQLGYFGEANVIQLPGVWTVEVSEIGESGRGCGFSASVTMEKGERSETRIACPAVSTPA